MSEWSKRKYPAKLLLLGEYSLLYGSAAVTLPLKMFAAHWNRSNQKNPVHNFITYLYKNANFLDVTQLERDLSYGWEIVSDIPIGSGLGSSGAFCAAVYQRYAKDKTTNKQKLKLRLSKLENYFHGSSSGIDPLTSLLNEPLLLKDNQISELSCQLPSGIYLYDTKIPRRTDVLVNTFKDKLKKPAFKNRLYEQLIPSVNNACDALTKNQTDSFAKNWRCISTWQHENMREMIPDAVANIWKSGIDSDQYYFKLCGAGGGGFMLLYCPEKYLFPNNFPITKIS